MNLWNKIRLAIGGVAHNVANELPTIPMLEQALREEREQLQAALGAVDQQVARKNVLVNEVADLEAEISRWTDNAKRAKEAGDMDLARQCLTKKQPIVADMESKKNLIGQLEASIETSRGQVEQLTNEIDEHERQLDQLRTLSETTKLQETVNNVLDTNSSNNLGGAFNELGNKIKMESEAAKARGQRIGVGEDNLETQVKKLDSKSKIDDELANL